MGKLFIVLSLIFTLSGCVLFGKNSTNRQNNPIIVAVIDTGFGYHQSFGKEAKLCQYGHKNFTNDPASSHIVKTVIPVPYDDNNHGTNIAGIIQKYAEDSNYCMVIIKYWSKNSKEDAILATVKSIRYATKIGAKIINYSSFGTERNENEIRAVKEFLNNGGIMVVAAGNDGRLLNKNTATKLDKSYPTMDDDRVISVGALDITGKIRQFSNYGEPVNRWELGENVEGFGITLSGTSQAAAVATGKIIKELDLKEIKDRIRENRMRLHQ
jgi:major intracellular serine protease